MLGPGSAQLVGNISHQLIVQQICLVERQNLRFLGQAAAIFFQFLADRFPGFYRIITGRVDEMQQYLAALDMAKKAVANARSVRRAFDQSGNVGEHEFTPLVPNHTELRMDGCERIGADLGARVGHLVDQCRFAGIG